MGWFLGRCPGFSCGSHTPNRLLGPWDGAQGFRADNPKPRNDSGHGCQVLRETSSRVWCTRSSTDTVCSVWLQELSRSASCRNGARPPSSTSTSSKPRVHADAPRMAEHGCSPAAPTNRRNQHPPACSARTSDTSRDQSVSAARTADLGHVEKVRSGLLLLILHVPSKAASAAGHPKTTPQREAAPWCFRKSPGPSKASQPGKPNCCPNQSMQCTMWRGLTGMTGTPAETCGEHGYWDGAQGFHAVDPKPQRP